MTANWDNWPKERPTNQDEERGALIKGWFKSFSGDLSMVQMCRHHQKEIDQPKKKPHFDKRFSIRGVVIIYDVTYETLINNIRGVWERHEAYSEAQKWTIKQETLNAFQLNSIESNKTAGLCQVLPTTQQHELSSGDCAYKWFCSGWKKYPQQWVLWAK